MDQVRESTASSTEIAKREHFRQEQLEAEQKILFDLKAELETQENVIKHFQSLVHEYKDERDELRHELALVTKKLQERTQSIDAIESEVLKARDAFRKKEESITREKEEALKNKELEHLEMRLTFEAQTEKLNIYEKEREAFVQKIRELEYASEALKVEVGEMVAKLK